MESFTKLKYKIPFLCLFFLCIFKLNAQEIYNYENLALQSNQALKNKVDSILNSNDIFLVNSNISSRNSYENVEILDIRYNNLNQLRQIDSSQLLNLKYCILRLQNNSNPIDLNLLNPLTNLEVIHIIIETNFSGNPSVINLINQNIIITYIISIPQ
jgi:hypothetical protein